MNRAARLISYIFHPLLMPTLGLLLILNSGTYLSLIDPVAKRAILFVMALGTLFIPLMMLPMLFYRNLVNSTRESLREKRLVHLLMLLIFYVITFIYFVRLPVSRVIHGYVLSVSILLFVVLLVSVKFKICGHMAALGGMTGLIAALMLLYETPLQGILIVSLLATGLTGSARLITGAQRPAEVYSGFLVGFGVVLATFLLY
ncbi:MAG: hypothetical protein ABFS10_03680 [Bacteroidota bacterium]